MQKVLKIKYVESVGSKAFLGSDSLFDFNDDILKIAN